MNLMELTSVSQRLTSGFQRLTSAWLQSRLSSSSESVSGLQKVCSYVKFHRKEK